MTPDELLTKARAYKTSDAHAGFLILRLVELVDATESERKHWEMTAGTLRTDLEYAERDLAEARAKLAQYERWQGDAEKVAGAVAEQVLTYFDIYKIGSVAPISMLIELAMKSAAAQAVAAEREENAKLIEPNFERPCDCDNCYCGNIDDAEAVAAWDEGKYLAAAIRNRSAT